MSTRVKNIKWLLSRYKALMEEAYNLRETDPDISDYDFYEGLKLRSFLELQHKFKFKRSTNELID